ncbi:MAG TPA: heavy-metal-associated domain-containing protein [Burkholderiales bacterium]|nr:heavy-metal-associated domain-containing protein [Burkholderiales bacterium]
MKTFLYAIAVSTFLFAGNVWAAATVKMRVDGLVCAFCGAAIEKKLRALPATVDVLVSLENKIVAVAFKEGQNVSDEQLKTVINDAGYEVKGIERGSEPLDDLRKALKLKKGS